MHSIFKTFGLLVCLIAVPAYATEFKMATGATAPLATSDNQGFLNQVATEAFQRLGHQVKITSFPPARAINLANSGNYDGDMQRVPGLNTRFPNLIMVPEKINDYDFVAYTLNPNFTSLTFKDLPKYRVGYLRGWKLYENNIPPNTDTVIVDSPKQLLEILYRKRVDVILYSRWEALWWGRELGINIHAIEPPLKSLEMFMYLNKKHRNLVSPLAQAIRKMKQEGRFEEIKQLTLHSLQATH